MVLSLDQTRQFSHDLPEVTFRANPAGKQVADTMREFMHYITNAFYGATGWNEDNTYQELNATARGRFLFHPSCQDLPF